MSNIHIEVNEEDKNRTLEELLNDRTIVKEWHIPKVIGMKTKKYKKEQYDEQIKRDEYIGKPRYN